MLEKQNFVKGLDVIVVQLDVQLDVIVRGETRNASIISVHLYCLK